MSVYSTLFSQTFFGLLFCYLTITDVTMYLQIIDFQFPSCCTLQPKKTQPNHYCEQFYEDSYHQKNNSCTLCVSMFGVRCWEIWLNLHILCQAFNQDLKCGNPKCPRVCLINWTTFIKPPVKKKTQFSSISGFHFLNADQVKVIMALFSLLIF